jgi:hypothetical protein
VQTELTPGTGLGRRITEAAQDPFSQERLSIHGQAQEDGIETSFQISAEKCLG